MWVFISLIAFDLLLVGLVFIPPIQNFIVGKVTQMMTDKWKSEFSIAHVYVTPLMNMVGTDVVFRDHHDNKMIYVPYVKSHINGLSFKPFQIIFGKTYVENADVIVRKYKNEPKVNMAMWADRIKAAKKKTETTVFRIHFDQIDMQKSRFLFQNDNEKLDDNQGIIDYAFFELKDIRMIANNFNLENKLETFELTALINSLGLKQYTGFEIKDMTGNFTINAFGLSLNDGHLITNNSNAFLDFNFHYSNWSSYGFFVDSVMFDSQVKHGRIDMNDVACFAPKIKGMDNMITLLGGKVSGPINALKATEIDAKIGDFSFFKGDFEIDNIVSTEAPSYHLNLAESSFQVADLIAFKLPKGKQLTQLSKITGLKEAQIKGYFDGTFRSFDTHFDITSNMGDVSASMNAVQQNKKINFTGDVATNGINLGAILENPKLFNQVALKTTISGSIPDEETLHFDKATVTIDGQVPVFGFAGYDYQNIGVVSTIADGKVEAKVNAHDDNCLFDITGTVQFAEEKPDIMAQLIVNDIQISTLFSKYHLPEKPTDGLEQVISFLRNRPDMALAAQSIEVHILGTKIDNMNGYVSINGLNISQGNLKMSGEWLRLTVMNTQAGMHKFILASNLVNASLSTNYELSGIKDTLIDLAYSYLPRFLPPKDIKPTENSANNTKNSETSSIITKNGYLNFEVETFQTRQIMAMFFPNISIAPRSSLAFNTDFNHHINIQSKIPRLNINNKVSVYGLLLDAEDEEKNNLKLSLHVDTIAVGGSPSKMSFKEIDMTGTAGNDHVFYDLNWLNPPAISSHSSHIAGTFDAISSQTIGTRVTASSIYLKEKEWIFNKFHEIVFEKDKIHFDDVVMNSGESKLAVRGDLSQSIEDNLFIDINNVDMSLLNSFLSSMKIQFAGDGSADFIYRMQANHQRILTGRAYVSDFVFNGSKFGNFFAVASANAKGVLTFSGGLFKKDSPVNSAIIEDYGVADFQNEPNRIADLRGYYLPENKTLTVHGDIDTIDIRFLQPFFTSFSHHISGVASGDISFIAKPDSTYFDGTAIVQEGQLGIKVLNTIYNLNNQIVEFDQKGISFNHVKVTDKDNNVAMLDGYVQHHNFKNFKMKFTIETDRILALNTPKNSDTYFYGDGYVAGNVSIEGDASALHFKGSNLRTLPGTVIYLPLTFSDHVSQTEGIRFKIDTAIAANRQSHDDAMLLDFDFLFTITKDAIVNMILDPSIGGTISASVIGPFRVTYRSDESLNLNGDLTLVSGEVMLAIKDLINQRLGIVPGGTISFNGPIDDSRLNLTALYTTSTTLTDILGQDVSGVSRNNIVNAYMNVSGNLFNPNIGFSFKLPNSNNEINNMLMSKIDTTNPQNNAKQFFSLLLMNKFIAQDFASEGLLSTGTLENTGTTMLTSLLSNMISKNFKFINIDLNIKNADDLYGAEYGGIVSIPLFNGRATFTANLNYATNQENVANNVSNFMGDFTVAVPLNPPENNWQFKIYNFNDQYSLDNQTTQNSQGVGISLLFQQEFNNRKDFINNYRRNKKKTKNISTF